MEVVLVLPPGYSQATKPSSNKDYGHSITSAFEFGTAPCISPAAVAAIEY